MFRNITLFLAGIAATAVATAQCPTISCSGNISVVRNTTSCDKVVTYAAPVASDPCFSVPVSTTYTYTGSSQTLTVPAGVTSITVEAKGAGGGYGTAYGSIYGQGGPGGRSIATLAVTAGQVITINVGGKGGNSGYYQSGTAGWNGGGSGGGSYYAGGGGGGASDIRIGGTSLGDRKVVAGGGGGGGANCSTETGGMGGGTTGGDGIYCGNVSSCNSGYGGSQTGGGAAAGCYTGSAFPGSQGQGGNGYSYGGGGGGGGWWGGGGGAWAGAGGGSGYVVTGSTGVSLTSGAGAGASTDGSVKITYTPNPTVAQTAGLPSGATYPVGVTTNKFVITGGGGMMDSCSFTVTVTDPTAPVINAEPVDTTRICVGGSITLTASATNSPNYRWYRNNTIVNNGSNLTGATSTTLSITNITAAQMGIYTLRATSTCAADTSATSAVILSNNAAVTTQPVANQNICVGNPFTISAATSDASGYTWLKNGTPLANGGDVSGANTNTLTIANADANDIAAYTLAISGNSGCASTTSNAGNINVNPAAAVIAYPPSNISMCSGGPVTIDVTANSAYGYQWYKNGNPLSNGGDISGATTSQLIVNNADNTDAGTYHVVVLGNPGCNNVTVPSTAVNINNIPVISAQPQATQNVCAGTNLVVNVVATNGTGYQWYKNNTPLTNGANITGANSAILTVSNTVAGDAGNYTVQVAPQTGCPALNSNASAVTINPNASVLTQPLPVVQVCEGNSVLLSVTGGAVGSYQWYKNGNALPNGLGVSGSNTANLRVDNTNAMSSGTYKAMMTAFYNGCAGATSANSQVTVTPLAGTLAGSGATETMTHMDGMTRVYTDNNCAPIVKVVDPSGGNVLGTVNSRMTLDGTVMIYNLQPYVQRHVDVEPTNNGLATVTLYATQQDFDSYNTYVGLSAPHMPTGGVDNGNIRVWQFHGTGTAPGNYTGSTEVLTPAPGAVTWNGAWYEIVVQVGGFSGFYFFADQPLSIKLKDISASNAGTANIVKWSTATEDAGGSFNIERSTDGRAFTQIASVNGKGKSSEYSFTDDRAITGTNYYRVQLIEAGGVNTFSNIVSARVEAGGMVDMKAYPNPATDKVTVTLSEEAGNNANIEVLDFTGKSVKAQSVSGSSAVIDMSNLPAGMYILKYTDGINRNSIKINKQ